MEAKRTMAQHGAGGERWYHIVFTGYSSPAWNALLTDWQAPGAVTLTQRALSPSDWRVFCASAPGSDGGVPGPATLILHTPSPLPPQTGACLVRLHRDLMGFIALAGGEHVLTDIGFKVCSLAGTGMRQEVWGAQDLTKCR